MHARQSWSARPRGSCRGRSAQVIRATSWTARRSRTLNSRTSTPVASIGYGSSGHALRRRPVSYSTGAGPSSEVGAPRTILVDLPHLRGRRRLNRSHNECDTTCYNRKRDAPRSHDVHESAAAARAGVRLFRRCCQPGAHHAAGTPLPDPHAAADPDARGSHDRLQAPLARGSVALAGAYRRLAATTRVRRRAVARPLSRLEAHPPVPRRWQSDDRRRRCALQATVRAVWRRLPSAGAPTTRANFPISPIGCAKLPPRRTSRSLVTRCRSHRIRQREKPGSSKEDPGPSLPREVNVGLEPPPEAVPYDIGL